MTTTQERGLEFIEHHGVKGMHWGVRRAEKRAAKKLAKGDKKFEKSAGSTKTWVQVHNAAGDKFNAHIDELNKKHPQDFSNEPFHNPLKWSEHYKSYMNDVAELERRSLQESVDELGHNPSGTRKVVLKLDEQNGGWWLQTADVKHAATQFKVVPQFDATGRVVSMKLIGDSMMQTADMGENFVLTHYGIKGMHWGVRREEIRTARLAKRAAKEEKRRANPGRAPAPVRVSESIGVSSVKKTTIKTVGGEDHPAHPDAITVAVSRQKLKRSGIHTLSNAELQQMNQRMQLEAQVHSLSSGRKKGIGQGFVDTHLAKAQKDPYGYAIKTHKVGKQAKNFMTKKKEPTAA